MSIAKGMGLVFVKNFYQGVILVGGLYLLLMGIKREEGSYLLLGWGTLLLAAPFYSIASIVILVVLICLRGWGSEGASSSSGNGYLLYSGIIGYAWIAGKICFTTIWSRQEQKEQNEREEKARRAEEKAERVRLSTIKTERKLDSTACKVILKSISELFSFCLEPATEMIRIAGALNGTNAPAPKLLVLCDIAAIIRGFRNADDPTNAYTERVCREITKRHLHGEEGSLLDYAKGGEKPTLLVSVLADYDKLLGTNTASRAASIYLGVVAEVANHCRDSLAVRLVTATYVGMLKPYVLVGGNSNTKP